MTRDYWLDLFTGATWEEFLRAGGNVSGFRRSREKGTSKIKRGDYLLCYCTGISRFIGLLEVVGDYFYDETPIWESDPFPCRLPVKILVKLAPENAVPVKEFMGKVSYMRDLVSPNAWTGHFRGSPIKEKEQDALEVIRALEKARDFPESIPFDHKKYYSSRKPKTYQAGKDEVTVPEEERISEQEEAKKGLVTHEEIQWTLLKLGSDLGLNVYVASNDRNKEYQGKRFADIERLVEDLPLTFDEATNRTIRMIDVLWLEGNSIEAAFEIEHTTSIYSGLLRLSDLISMQPNINIRLYIVAPDERRSKVFEEVLRPTFTKMRPPLSTVCQYISYTTLKGEVKAAAKYLQDMKATFVESIAETISNE